VFEWDRIGAEKEFRRAIELDPNNPDIRSTFAEFLTLQKRFDEAIAEGRRAVELDPLSKRLDLTYSLTAARRFDEAIAEVKAVIQLDPNYADAYGNLGWAYIAKGSYREAIAALQRYIELDDDPTGRGLLALAHARTGSRDEAVKQLDWLKQEASWLTCCIVSLYAGSGDQELPAQRHRAVL
jgi:serine/threonine-protein kinase